MARFLIGVGGVATTASSPFSTAIAASVIALDSATQTAFPTARCEARLPFGSRHEDGKPIKTELSRAVITRTVCPSGPHHVSAWPAQTVKLCASTVLVVGQPPWLRVWFLQ